VHGLLRTTKQGNHGIHGIHGKKIEEEKKGEEQRKQNLIPSAEIACSYPLFFFFHFFCLFFVYSVDSVVALFF